MTWLLISGLLIMVAIFVVVFFGIKKTRKINLELKEKKEELDNMLLTLQQHLSEREKLSGKVEEE
ncbi:MAG: hypothetical protein JXR56_03240 [Candidatus Cloacimonetes bacterium]|nr:hypothetical protein [Candidatus Cloacimonadota bacterium]